MIRIVERERDMESNNDELTLALFIQFDPSCHIGTHYIVGNVSLTI